MERAEIDYLPAHLQSVPAFRALLRAIECRLLWELGCLEDPVVDIGCGDGHFASLALQGQEIVGLDLDADALRAAKTRGIYAQLLQASGTHLPLEDAAFSTVISNCSIEHIRDLPRVLDEAHRVLKPGGRFVFGVPSQHFADLLLGTTLFQTVGARNLATAYGQWFHRHSRHYHVYTPDEWKLHLTRHGFHIMHWNYYMSAAGHRLFDLLHYLGVPSLLHYKLTGRWTLWPALTTPLLTRLLRPYYTAPAPARGAYIFFDCKKVAHMVPKVDNA